MNPKRDLIDVAGKVVYLSGAAGLFGRQISPRFLEKGSKLVLGVHRQQKRKDLAEMLEQDFSRDRFIILPLELSESASVMNFFSKGFDRFGQLDVLINNAAVDAKFDADNIEDVENLRFENYPFELIERAVNINTLGTIRMTQCFCRKVLDQGGAANIINVASIYALMAPDMRLYDYPESPAQFKPVDYVASKSFLPNFTRYIATLYAGDGIRCNAIAPHGVFDNHDRSFLKSFASLSPVGRMCEPEELELPFLFLASDGASYVNGTTLVVDGGWSAR